MPATANSMRRHWGILAVSFLCACTRPDRPVEDPTTVVTTMLASSAEAWNAGNLSGFIDDYANDPATSFMDGRRPQYGYDWVRSNYAPRFEPEAARDSLRFEDFAARRLGDNHILATARYVLHRDDTATSSGPFTLILERRDGKWKIIHDHTNADPD